MPMDLAMPASTTSSKMKLPVQSTWPSCISGRRICMFSQVERASQSAVFEVKYSRLFMSCVQEGLLLRSVGFRDGVDEERA
jgi:hypothetical protein